MRLYAQILTNQRDPYLPSRVRLSSLSGRQKAPHQPPDQQRHHPPLPSTGKERCESYAIELEQSDRDLEIVEREWPILALWPILDLLAGEPARLQPKGGDLTPSLADDGRECGCGCG